MNQEKTLLFLTKLYLSSLKEQREALFKELELDQLLWSCQKRDRFWCFC